MCDVLKLPRSTYYDKAKEQDHSEDELAAAILEIFQKSRHNDGTRKIKHELKKLGIITSRRRIGRIMKKAGWYQTIQLPSLSPMWINAMNQKWKTC
jgi:putative transposase